MTRNNSKAKSMLEPLREIPWSGECDVLVCGGGPAGVCAALSAAREGAQVILVENQGCLGGVWTSGLLSLILDGKGKGGILQEIKDRLAERGAVCGLWLYDAEEMKLLLEEMVEEAGIDWLLHTRVVEVTREGESIHGVVIENKSGRSSISARIVIDTTGDGDVAAMAGCGFEYGHPDSGTGQPMTMMAIVQGVPGSVGETDEVECIFIPKEEFRQILLSTGHQSSYSKPSLFKLPNGLFCFMIHHGYEFNGLSAADVTRATHEGRREVMRAARLLREKAPGWQDFRVVATAAHIGVREGRRIQGLYSLAKEDVADGSRFEDAVCRVHFPVDVHALKRTSGGGYDNAGIVSLPYDIPYRSLVAARVHGLLLAGRCISGDFYAHASYRVTGNACATGEAAGRSAAFCVARDLLPHEITWASHSPSTLDHSPLELQLTSNSV